MNALLRGIGSVLNIAPKTDFRQVGKFDSADRITAKAWLMVAEDINAKHSAAKRYLANAKARLTRLA